MVVLSPRGPIEDATKETTCSRCGAAVAEGTPYCTLCGTASPVALAHAGNEAEAAEEGLVGAGREGERTTAAADTAVAPRRHRPSASAPRLAVHDALERNSLFSLLPSRARQLLADSCFRRRYPDGGWAVREGQVGQRAFLVAHGHALVWAAAGRGRRVVMRRLGPSDYFGEPFGVSGRRRAVSVQAQGPLETYVFAEDKLAEVASASPFFREALVQHSEVAVREAFLRRASPFAPFEPEVLLDLAARIEPVSYGVGENVFEQGDAGDAFYVVRRGSVAVIADGNLLATLRVGDCFGEAALLTGQPRSATIRVEDPTEALRLSRADFDRILDQHTHLRRFFVELLRRRDLLTPSVERVSARPVSREAARDGAASATAIDYRGTRVAVLLAAAGSALLALLATAPRGSYLMGAAVAAALAVTPFAGALLARALRKGGELALRRPAALSVGSALSALVAEGLLLATSTLGYGLGALATGVVARPLLLMGIIGLGAGRRGFSLELDGMVAGALAGLGYGLADPLLRWSGLLAGSPPALTPAAWYDLLISPAAYAVAGSLVGAGIWEARYRRSALPLLTAMSLAAVLLLLNALPRALELSTLLTFAVATGALWGGLRVAQSRLREALEARAEALASLGLSGVLSAGLQEDKQVFCWGCGAGAGAGELYCSRCGQSLVEELEVDG